MATPEEVDPLLPPTVTIFGNEISEEAPLQIQEGARRTRFVGSLDGYEYRETIVPVIGDKSLRELASDASQIAGLLKEHILYVVYGKGFIISPSASEDQVLEAFEAVLKTDQ